MNVFLQLSHPPQHIHLQVVPFDAQQHGADAVIDTGQQVVHAHHPNIVPLEGGDEDAGEEVAGQLDVPGAGHLVVVATVLREAAVQAEHKVEPHQQQLDADDKLEDEDAIAPVAFPRTIDDEKEIEHVGDVQTGDDQRDIEEHAVRFDAQQWQQLCDVDDAGGRPEC